MNNMDNKTIMFWQTIIKNFVSMTSDTNAKVGDNVASTNSSILLYPI